MKIFSFLFLFIVSFILPAGVAAQDGGAPTPVWQVTKYDIAATLPAQPADRNLTARATVSLRNVGRGAGSTVTFRINQKAEITGAKVGAAAANFRKSIEDKIGSLQRFTVTLPGAIQPNGETAVTVEYRLNVAENTGLTAISATGAQFLPLAVWYPTINNPYNPRGADAAPVALSVTARDGETVIAAGSQGLNLQPFFLAGNWEETSGANNISVFLPKGAGADERKRAAELANLTNDANLFAASLLGVAPAVKFRLVGVERGSGFADGGAILLDYAAFRRQKIDAVTALMIAEAVAKTWLGNATPARGEGFGAIHEGLARFVALKFIEKQFGRDAADVERLKQRAAYAAAAKLDAPLAQLSPLDNVYFAVAPTKGALVWQLAAREMGEDKFFGVIRALLESERANGLRLARLREELAAVGGAKMAAILNYGFDLPSEMDLLAGLPLARGAESVVNLKNTGSLPVTVSVAAVTDKGERLLTTATVPQKDFGQAVFKTAAKIVRVEIDPDKIYPQTDYSNDVAPRETMENDWNGEIKRAFDRQDFAKAETAARKAVAANGHFDDARTWLGRALLEQNKLDEAEKEFNFALAEKLPTARTMAWANIGLGEIAARRGNDANAVKFFDAAIRADAEYGANLAARAARSKADAAPAIDDTIRTFFAAFDKAVLTAKKAEVDAFILGGELAAFSGRLTGNQPETWQTKVLRTESLDANRMAVEVGLNAKLINRDPTTGTALFFLARTPTGWKLAGVDLFEVR